jgi:hypothetical protein
MASLQRPAQRTYRQHLDLTPAHTQLLSAARAEDLFRTGNQATTAASSAHTPALRIYYSSYCDGDLVLAPAEQLLQHYNCFYGLR